MEATSILGDKDYTNNLKLLDSVMSESKKNNSKKKSNSINKNKRIVPSDTMNNYSLRDLSKSRARLFCDDQSYTTSSTNQNTHDYIERSIDTNASYYGNNVPMSPKDATDGAFKNFLSYTSRAMSSILEVDSIKPQDIALGSGNVHRIVGRKSSVESELSEPKTDAEHWMDQKLLEGQADFIVNETMRSEVKRANEQWVTDKFEKDQTFLKKQYSSKGPLSEMLQKKCSLREDADEPQQDDYEIERALEEAQQAETIQVEAAVAEHVLQSQKTFKHIKWFSRARNEYREANFLQKAIAKRKTESIPTTILDSVDENNGDKTGTSPPATSTETSTATEPVKHVKLPVPGSNLRKPPPGLPKIVSGAGKKGAAKGKKGGGKKKAGGAKKTGGKKKGKK